MNRSIFLVVLLVVLVGHCAAAGALRQVKRREFIRIDETDFIKELIDEDASFWARELSAFSTNMSLSGSKKSRKSRKKKPSKGEKTKAEDKDQESARVPNGKESDSVKEDDAATAGSPEVPPVTSAPAGSIPVENMKGSVSESAPAPLVGSSRTQQTTSTKSPSSTTATTERPEGDVLVEKVEDAESESTLELPATTSSAQQTTTTQSPPSTATTTEKPGSDLSVVAPRISVQVTGESATGKEPNEEDMESAKDGEKQGGSLGSITTVASAAPVRSLATSAGIAMCVIVGAVFLM